MAALSTQNIVNAGTKPTFGAASTSDTAEIGSGLNTMVIYKNTGTQKVVTITVPGNTSYGEPTPDPALTLLATTGELWVPLRKAYDPGDGSGRATLTLDDATAVTVAVVRLG